MVSCPMIEDGVGRLYLGVLNQLFVELIDKAKVEFYGRGDYDEEAWEFFLSFINNLGVVDA